MTCVLKRHVLRNFYFCITGVYLLLRVYSVFPDCCHCVCCERGISWINWCCSGRYSCITTVSSQVPLWRFFVMTTGDFEISITCAMLYIVFTPQPLRAVHALFSLMASRWEGWGAVCLGCISETMRYRELKLGRDIDWECKCSAS